jgi:antitoxin component YwqK of YwqJK toxin-antitoxin module
MRETTTTDSFQTIVEYNDISGDISEVTKITTHGDSIFWKSYVNGRLLFRKEFSASKNLDYIFYIYDKEGNLENKAEFIDGQKNGEERSYYKSGKLKTITKYKNGVPTGKFLQYYESETLYLKSDSIGNGLLYVYDTLGKLTRVDLYKDFEHVKRVK